MAEIRGWMTALLSQGRLGDSEGWRRDWPIQTEGDETLRQIREVCLRTTSSEALSDVDEELAKIVLPERRRLQKNMTDAINRMLALLYNGA
jgi:hypothetical protein